MATSKAAAADKQREMSIKKMVDELLFLWLTYGCAQPKTLTLRAKRIRRDVRREIKRLLRGVANC